MAWRRGGGGSTVPAGIRWGSRMHSSGDAAAIVLAGGSGTRVGGPRNKVYLPLRGSPVIAWSLATLAALPGIGVVVLVVRDADRDLAERSVQGTAVVEIVTGGATRQESELAGLRLLAARITAGVIGTVLIHDGARPLLSGALAADVLRTALEVGGAVPGLPRDDLAAAGPDGIGLAGPAPAGLVAVQTPQGFRAAPLLAAYEEAARLGFSGTDTASCVAAFAPDVPIRAVEGEGRNFKITHGHDLQMAERVLARDADDPVG